MSTQIAVRLPDPVVAFLDEEVAAGRVASRAALVFSPTPGMAVSVAALVIYNKWFK